MRIGELAEEAGLTPSAVRFYERAGVLPAPRRTASGYRDYDASQLERLAFIRAGQAVGLTLAELADIVAFRERGEVPCAHVIALIDKHAVAIADRIAELQRVQGDLARLAARARTLDPAECRPDRVCHVVVDPADLPG